MTSAMTTYLVRTVQIAAAPSRPRVRLKYRTPTTTTATTTASEDFPVSTSSEEEEEVRIEGMISARIARVIIQKQIIKTCIVGL